MISILWFKNRAIPSTSSPLPLVILHSSIADCYHCHSQHQHQKCPALKPHTTKQDNSEEIWGKCAVSNANVPRSCYFAMCMWSHIQTLKISTLYFSPRYTVPHFLNAFLCDIWTKAENQIGLTHNYCKDKRSLTPHEH